MTICPAGLSCSASGLPAASRASCKLLIFSREFESNCLGFDCQMFARRAIFARQALRLDSRPNVRLDIIAQEILGEDGR